MTRSGWWRWLKSAIFLLCLLPFAGVAPDTLLADLPLKSASNLTRLMGVWALIFLLLTLALTPLRFLAGWNDVVRLRRMLGLFSFFYALVHVAVYLTKERRFIAGGLYADVKDRPFILLGATALVILLLLAATSTNAMMRRLGAVRWKRLHRLVYPASVAVIIHMLFTAKDGAFFAFFFGNILVVLLGFRFATRRAVTVPAEHRPYASHWRQE